MVNVSQFYKLKKLFFTRTFTNDFTQKVDKAFGDNWAKGVKGARVKIGLTYVIYEWPLAVLNLTPIVLPR